MQRILVIGPGGLLDESLCLLLQGDKRLHVSRCTYTDDASFLDVVSRVRPDVIVLAGDENVSAMKIFELLSGTSPSAVFRIVSVHEDDNAIEIYDMASALVTRSRDVLQFVQRNGSLDRK